MTKKYSVICALDPGVSGGITILENGDEPKVYRIPIRNIVVNKKKKKEYDLKDIVDLLKPYKRKKVLFVQERVGVRPGEGGVSAFSFGKSVGSTLGIAYGLEFDVSIVSPISWKKKFPELEGNGVSDFRAEIKDVQAVGKTIKGKTKKDKEAKKANKKLVDKLKRQLKSQAKTNARLLASKLYPALADNFKQVNQDGVAESLLIALYGRNKQNELV